MQITLTPAERSAIRAHGGTAFVPLVRLRGPRGAKYRPIRGNFWRTEEQAQTQLASMRRRFLHGRQLDAGSTVLLVDAAGDVA